MKLLALLFCFALSGCATLSNLAGSDYDTESEYIAALTAELNETNLPESVKSDLIAELTPLWGEYSDSVADWYDLREAIREAIPGKDQGQIARWMNQDKPPLLFAAGAVPDAIDNTTNFALTQIGAFGPAFALLILVFVAVIVGLVFTIWQQRKDNLSRIKDITDLIDAANQERLHWQSQAYQDRRETAELARQTTSELNASLQTIERVMDVIRGR